MATRRRLKRRYNSVMARGERVIAISRFRRRSCRERSTASAPDRLRIDPARRRSRPLRSRARRRRARRPAWRAQWRLPDGVPVVMLPGRLTRWKGELDAHRGDRAARPARSAAACWSAPSSGAAFAASSKRRSQRAGSAAVFRIVERLPRHAGRLHAGRCRGLGLDRPEGFGRVIVEAQAMGRPVVATDHGGARETIVPGETGWLVPPGDAAALAAAIDAGAGARARRRAQALGRRAIAHVAREFHHARRCARARSTSIEEMLFAETRPGAVAAEPATRGYAVARATGRASSSSSSARSAISSRRWGRRRRSARHHARRRDHAADHRALRRAGARGALFRRGLDRRAAGLLRSARRWCACAAGCAAAVRSRLRSADLATARAAISICMRPGAAGMVGHRARRVASARQSGARPHAHARPPGRPAAPRPASPTVPPPDLVLGGGAISRASPCPSALRAAGAGRRRASAGEALAGRALRRARRARRAARRDAGRASAARAERRSARRSSRAASGGARPHRPDQLRRDRRARRAARSSAVGNDTGPMHLFVAAGCPATVLYSAASDPALTAPRGARCHHLAPRRSRRSGGRGGCRDAVLRLNRARMNAPSSLPSPSRCPTAGAPLSRRRSPAPRSPPRSAPASPRRRSRSSVDGERQDLAGRDRPRRAGRDHHPRFAGGARDPAPRRGACHGRGGARSSIPTRRSPSARRPRPASITISRATSRSRPTISRRSRQRMHEIVDRDEPITREVWERDEAVAFFKAHRREATRPNGSARSRATRRSASIARATSSISAPGRICRRPASSARPSS